MTRQTVPPISGWEDELHALMQDDRRPHNAGQSAHNDEIKSCFCCALHMHQPTIPAGKQGELISHLEYMFDHSEQGDNHNAGPFAHCYRRLADIIPDLIHEGCEPKIMLDYSGNLLKRKKK